MVNFKKSKTAKISIVTMILAFCTVFTILWFNRQFVINKVNGFFEKSIELISGAEPTPDPSENEKIRYESDTELLNTFKLTSLPNTSALRAMKINIGEGKDFLSGSVKTAGEQQTEMNSILDYAVNNGMNAVIIDATPFCDSVYQSKYLQWSSAVSGVQGTTPEYDLLKYVCDTAKSKGLKVIASISPLLVCQNGNNAENHKSPYLNLIVKSSDGSVYYNPGLPETRDLISNVATEIAQNYDIFGIILDNPSYPSKDFDDSFAYQKYGNGLTLEDFRRRNINLIIAQTVSEIKKIKPELLVGANVYGIWGTSPDMQDGVSLSAPSTSYNDYYQDSLKWIKSNWLDFISPKLEWSMENTALPFDTLSKWWSGAVKDTGTQLYITHTAYKIGSGEEGWANIDQLSKQYNAARTLSGYCGSIFDGYAALCAHPNDTSALTLLFKDLLDFTTLNNNLVITEPKNNTVTDSSSISIRGICDNNFPLYLNDKEITPTSKGLFAVDVNLSPGTNTFKLQHKGVTQTLTVTYNIVILKEISPSTDISAGGGAQITVSAVAHTGAKVTAQFNGQKINLSEQLPSEDETDNLRNTEFARFIGSYTLPASTASAQNLGTITFTVTYNGFSKTKKSGKITVTALPPTPAPTPVPTPSPTPSPGATAAPPIQTLPGPLHIMEITSPNIQTYDIRWAGDWSTPEIALLQQGTKDIIVGEEIYGGTRLWILKSGQKVIKSTSMTDYTVSEFPLSNITSASINNTSKYSEITFNGAKNTIYRGHFSGLYSSPSSVNDYSTSFSTNQYELTLYNTSSAPDLNISNSLFSSVQKTMVDSTTVKYTFNLKNTGKFYGLKVYFNSNGDLTVRFKNPITLSGNASKPLSGIKIMLDSGHGGTAPGAVVNGIMEKDLNWAITMFLKDMLIDLGAEVSVTRQSNSETITLQDIREKQWAWQPDLFLCIHNNSASSSSVRGAIGLYFYGYSSALSNNIKSKLMNNYGTNKYACDSRYQNLGALKNQECAGVLIECGFMTNAEELQNLCDPQYQIKCARAIADGVIETYN